MVKPQKTTQEAMGQLRRALVDLWHATGFEDYIRRFIRLLDRWLADNR